MTIPNTEIPIGTGLPTREELLGKIRRSIKRDTDAETVFCSDLGLLKRDKKLQQRYNLWSAGIKVQYGSLVNYLLKHRLQWGKPDTLSVLPSSLRTGTEVQAIDATKPASSTSTPPPYFTRDTPPEYISIIQNDWPYSVPVEIEHTLIWTKVPIYHSDLVPPSITARIHQDGIWGFTGITSPPPSPSTLPLCLPALSEWGITEDKMIVSPKGSEEEEELVRKAGIEVNEFIRKRWNEDEWETAWFVNPP
ncbi:hypothetical protein V5O48_016933, partial [Marasmius crinis-equi]